MSADTIKVSLDEIAAVMEKLTPAVTVVLNSERDAGTFASRVRGVVALRLLSGAILDLTTREEKLSGDDRVRFAEFIDDAVARILNEHAKDLPRAPHLRLVKSEDPQA